MVDYRDFRIMHRHDAEWVELRERAHHDPADHDPERAWPVAGAQILKCERCDEEVAVVPRDTPDDRR